jgi:tetratricopeptide (TPR) repeat protein
VSEGLLEHRLAVALDGAECEGGDIRGRQSAALLVVPAEGEEWETKISLRVEDHPEPLAELKRLIALREAYDLAGRADALVNEARYDEAARLYVQASELAPDNHELLFWAGLGSAQSGDLDTAVARVRQAIAMHPGWEKLLPKLPSDVAPAAPAVIDRLNVSAG